MVAEEAAVRHLVAGTDPDDVTAHRSNGALCFPLVGDAFRDRSGSPPLGKLVVN